jgi:hypothetical protein
LAAQIYGDDYVWVSTTNPPKNYTTADMAQLLADSTGYNASIIYRVLQSNSTHARTLAHDDTHAYKRTR